MLEQPPGCTNRSREAGLWLLPYLLMCQLQQQLVRVVAAAGTALWQLKLKSGRGARALTKIAFVGVTAAAGKGVFGCYWDCPLAAET